MPENAYTALMERAAKLRAEADKLEALAEESKKLSPSADLALWQLVVAVERRKD